MPASVSSSFCSKRRQRDREHQPDWPSCCPVLPFACSLLPASGVLTWSGRLWVHVCQQGLTDGDLDCVLGFWWSPEPRGWLPGPLGSWSGKQVLWTMMSGTGSPPWFGQTAGWGKVTPGCSGAGFRRETKIRPVVEITRVPGKIHVRICKNRFYNFSCTWQWSLLGWRCWRVSKIILYCRWRSEFWQWMSYPCLLKVSLSRPREECQPVRILAGNRFTAEGLPWI